MVAAQLTVPLVILENAQWSISYEERKKSNQDFQDLTDKPDITESLEGALKRLGKYQKQFSPEIFGRMGQEIKNIYEAAGVVRIAPVWPVCRGWGASNRLHPVYPPEPLHQEFPSPGLFSGYDVFREKQLPPGKTRRYF